MPFLFTLLILAALIFALVDIITRDESQVKHLPKVAWVLLVVLIPLIGTVLWFTLGREYEGARERMPRPARPRATPQAPVFAPPSSPAPMHDTRSTEQQLADLEREIEEERLRAEIIRKRRESERRTSGGVDA